MRDPSARLELNGGGAIYDLDEGSGGDCDTGNVVVRGDLTLLDLQHDIGAATLCGGSHVWTFEGSGVDVDVTLGFAVHFGNVTIAPDSTVTFGNGGGAGFFVVDDTLFIEGTLTLAASVDAGRVVFVGGGGTLP
jgi:hypothetical protein